MNQNYAQKSADVIKSPFPAVDCQRLRAGLRESSFFINLTGISSEGEFDEGCQLKAKWNPLLLSWGETGHPSSQFKISLACFSLSVPNRSSDLGL